MPVGITFVEALLMCTGSCTILKTSLRRIHVIRSSITLLLVASTVAIIFYRCKLSMSMQIVREHVEKFRIQGRSLSFDVAFCLYSQIILTSK